MEGFSYNKDSILEKYDSTPTTGSTKLVNSGNIKNYVDGEIATIDSAMDTLEANVNSVLGRIGNPFTFKGTVVALSNLPSSGNTVNDTYFVTNEGFMYTWNGSSWDKTSTDVNNQLAHDIATEYDGTKADYKQGQLVLYNNQVYIRKANATEAEGTFVAANWTATSLGDELYNEVTNLKSALSIVSDDKSYEVYRKELEDGRLSLYLTSGTKKSLEDVAIYDLTYAELFESSRNQGINFDDGIVAPWSVNNGSPAVTTDSYTSKPQSLKCFGTTSQNIVNTSVSVQENHYYFVGAKVKVTNYTSGKVGILQGSVETAFTRTTEDFETISRIHLSGNTGLSTVFVGTFSTANANAYIDNVCYVDITDIYDQFDSATEANTIMKKLLDDYIEIKNTDRQTIKIAVKNDVDHTDIQKVNAFVEEMNEKAAALGMTGTHFYNPNGMIKTSYSTAQDIMKMAVAVCGYRRGLDIWSTPSLDLNVSGDHERTLNISNGFYTNMSSSISSHAKLLGGKGGSLIWGNEESDYHRANISIVDINGTVVALGLMGTGREVYGNLYNAARDLCYMVKTSLNGGTPTETNNLSNVVSSGGGYSACIVPNVSGAYTNSVLPSELVLRQHSQSNGETESQAPASTSKVMTMLVALDYLPDLHFDLTIKESDIFEGSGSTYYDGDIMSFYDAIRVMMMESSNTLANAVARHVGGIILS